MSDNKQVNLEKPEQIIDDTVAGLDAIHRTLVDNAIQVGHDRDALLAIRPLVVDLANASTTKPEAAQVYEGVINMFTTVRDEVRAQQSALVPLVGLYEPTSGSINSLIYATGTTASIVAITYNAPTDNLPLLPTLDQHEVYAKRFTRLDATLGKTYLEIWEVLYGTRAEPERGALYLIRQAFDHFFDKLAPVDDVRRSSYWTKKTELGKENG